MLLINTDRQYYESGKYNKATSYSIHSRAMSREKHNNHNIDTL